MPFVWGPVFVLYPSVKIACYHHVLQSTLGETGLSGSNFSPGIVIWQGTAPTRDRDCIQARIVSYLNVLDGPFGNEFFLDVHEQHDANEGALLHKPVSSSPSVQEILQLLPP